MTADAELHAALIEVYNRAADARAWVKHEHLGADCPMIALDTALAVVLRIAPDLRSTTQIPAAYLAELSARLAVSDSPDGAGGATE